MKEGVCPGSLITKYPPHPEVTSLPMLIGTVYIEHDYSYNNLAAATYIISHQPGMVTRSEAVEDPAE